MADSHRHECEWPILSGVGCDGGHDQPRLGQNHQHLDESRDYAARGFFALRTSKAALESKTIIWAKDLAGTGVTVNALLPGGASLAGMIPDEVQPALQQNLLMPEIMIPPLLWLVSESADGVTGKLINAACWNQEPDSTLKFVKASESVG